MENLFEKSRRLQQAAKSIMDDTGVIEHWTSVGATINLVGSLKTGLLINNRDIDFHIYTAPFKLSDSFLAVSKIAENGRISSVSYTNLLDAEDQCVEWHAKYVDRSGEAWQIDMIHILKESRFAGYFENVADRISAVLTDETRRAILEIKNALSKDEKVMSIQVYQAVIQGGVRDIDAFWRWKRQNPGDGIITWTP